MSCASLLVVGFIIVLMLGFLNAISIQQIEAQIKLKVLCTPQNEGPAAPRGRLEMATDSNNRIVGSDEKETIKGAGGDDCLIGKGGNDLIEGGSGKDILIGDGGSDELDGGNERSTIDVFYCDARLGEVDEALNYVRGVDRDVSKRCDIE